MSKLSLGDPNSNPESEHIHIMVNKATTTPATPAITAISVHLRSVRNNETGQCGWGAVILAGNIVGEEIGQLSGLCAAESTYDADILAAIAVLDHVNRTYASHQLKSITVHAAKGLCEGIDRTIASGGNPTGKPAFRPLWLHLYELVKETGTDFRRMPTGGPAAEISDRANEAAREAVGLPIDAHKSPVGKVACPIPDCETPCDAYLMKDGRWRAWCQQCRQAFFTGPSGEAPGGR